MLTYRAPTVTEVNGEKMRKKLTQTIIHGQSPWLTLDLAPDFNLQLYPNHRLQPKHSRANSSFTEKSTLWPPTTLAHGSRLYCRALAKPTIDFFRPALLSAYLRLFHCAFAATLSCFQTTIYFFCRFACVYFFLRSAFANNTAACLVLLFR